jgi:shikimate 5-dehydrogenase
LTGRCVYDLIYNPPTTRLLREARAAGCQIIGGLDMLVAQAHEQFQWWTNTRPASGVMQEAALKRLAEFTGDAHHVV